METLKNSIVNLDFVDINDDGFGVAKMDGKVVFVPYVISGESAEVKIIADKKNFCYGKIEKLNKVSKYRREPICPYFYKCGGCDIQHIDRDFQLELKTKKVVNAFKKIAGTLLNVSPCIGFSEYRYRNKIALPFSQNGKVGMYRKNSHDVIEIDDCEITKPWVKDLIEITNNFIKISGETIYDENTGRGLLRHIVAREVDDKILITFVINGEKIKKIDIFSSFCAEKFKNYSINININKKPGNVILGEKWINIFGDSFIESEKYGVKFQVSNASFFQVNDMVRDSAYGAILSEITENDSVIDAYSGAGMLTAFIAKKAKKAIGIEIIKEATRDANELKEKNKLLNMENINGDCAKVLPEVVKSLKDQNITIVLDPPRKGADGKVLESILSVKPNKIIYLSCNPSTLARDAKILCDGEYNIKSVQPYDMFPNTSHVETLVVFNLNN